MKSISAINPTVKENTLCSIRIKFQVKNSVRSAPASIALTQFSHYNMRTANHLVRGSGACCKEQRRAKMSFGM